MRCYSGNVTHMQPIEIQNMQSQRTMHVDKTQRPRLGWPCNHQAPPHFFLDFCQNKHPRSLSISTGPCKIRILTSNFTPFSLKENARNSLNSLLSNPWVHTLKERQDSILFLLHTLSK